MKIDTIIISEAIIIGIGQTLEIGDRLGRIEVDLGMSKIIGEVILEVT